MAAKSLAATSGLEGDNDLTITITIQPRQEGKRPTIITLAYPDFTNDEIVAFERRLAEMLFEMGGNS